MASRSPTSIYSARRTDDDPRQLRLCSTEPTTRSEIEQWVPLLRGVLPPGNIERLRGDAELAVEHLAPGSYFRSAALYVLEIISLLSRDEDAPAGGSLDAGDSDFRARSAAGLTAAELRLLPYLATQLSYREIGERLFIARSTVKSEAVSAYRKLCASSRSEAVQYAAELGLIEATAATQSGDRDPRLHALVGLAGSEMLSSVAVEL